MDSWKDSQAQVERQTVGKIAKDGQLDRQAVGLTDSWKDWQLGIQTAVQIDKMVDRALDGKTELWKERQLDRQTAETL